ncbi:IS66 family transposase [Rhizobium laguerreae]|uniref:IS66 family transposase n=1 Tax=Rhizobium laguerreae TaxID=1076926 RepID=UPI001FE0AC03|nr:transposase [Rhizobium laguerreae]
MSGTQKQCDCLTHYTNDGRMPIDKNTLQRDIRVFATASKSWLPSDTADGTDARTVIHSPTRTYRACGVAPLAWLRHVLSNCRGARKMPPTPTSSFLNSRRRRERNISIGAMLLAWLPAGNVGWRHLALVSRQR